MWKGWRFTAKSGGLNWFHAVFAVFISLIFISQSFAIITLGGTGRNTSAPTGSLADSGWQFEGLVGSYTGTALSPNTFITAKHIGNMVGASFAFDGKNYPVLSAVPDPLSDLVVYTIDGTLPAYAPLFSSPSGEAGLPIVMYGRGVGRGVPVSVGGKLKGWQWGNGDGSLSWGTGTVTGDYGAMYGWQFANNGDPNEGQVASGDSGGGVFVNDGGLWKLAGIINSVQEKFSTDGTDGTAVDAALFDTSGLYSQWGSTWSSFANGYGSGGTWGYATSISAHTNFIQQAVDTTRVPEPVFGIAALASVVLLRRSRSPINC